MRARPALMLACLSATSLATACADVPDLPASQAALDAPWPVLAPFDSFPPAAATAEDEAALAAGLDAQAAVLKGRAAALTATGG